MSQLVAAIEKVRQVAITSGKGLSEANAIHKLIMPVLKALGWDVDDIEHEYTCKGGGAVDIALMLDDKPRVMVEAKAYSLGASPSAADKNALQAISYGAAEGVEWCLLTNGGKYELYNTTVSLPLDEKLLLAVDVMSGSPDEAAERLALLGIDSVRNGQLDREGPRLLVEARLRQWLGEADADFVGLVSTRLKGKVGDEAVRAGMATVAAVAASPPQPHFCEPTPALPTKPALGTFAPMALSRPLKVHGTYLRLVKYGQTDGKPRRVQVPQNDLSAIITACCHLTATGEELTAHSVWEAAFGKATDRTYWSSLEGLGVLWALGALAHIGGKMPQRFRLVEGMTEAKIMALLEQALEEDKDKTPPQ